MTANLYQQAHESEAEAELELDEGTGTASPHDERTSYEWSERGSVAEDGGVVITFRGINQDEQDRLDAQNFVRGLKAPAKPDPDYEAIMAKARSSDGTPSEMSPQAQRLGVGVAFAVVTMTLVIPALFGALGSGWWILVVLLLAFAAGYFAPPFVHLLRHASSMPIRRDVRGAFEFQMTTKRFRCSGFRCDVAFELATVAAFVGDTHLSLLMTDGHTVRLPARLESRHHSALAMRLNEVLRDARASTYGYRGAP